MLFVRCFYLDADLILSNVEEKNTLIFLKQIMFLFTISPHILLVVSY